MPKTKEVYICSACGYETLKWNGRCPDCGAWNTFELQTQTAKPSALSSPLSGLGDAEQIRRIREIDVTDEVRYHTGMQELDRVLGGGIVKGSLVLLGGDPGIGKSTLLLQICEYVGRSLSILYISGEESARQIKLRANRLGVDSENLYIASVTDLDRAIQMILQQKPDLVMVDSIQTMSLPALASSPGSVAQVRECTNALMRVAKGEEVPIFIVGHVNKDGNIAGPKVMEHIVDAVLYFEGERQLSYRILRAVKNRYGSTNEIGVFEMRDVGLAEVENPSGMLLNDRPLGVSGTCVACVMEGTRPILAEVQALATKTGFGTPRRTSTGFDYNRLALLLAVLEKRAGFYSGALDVYVNIVGGLRLDEPAADLPVALSLISAITDSPIDERMIAFGEIGLTGEIRSVSHALSRLKEAERLGFTRCILPKQSLEGIDTRALGIEAIGVRNIQQAAAAMKTGH
ncbi:MAG TPA: DNA repair protein RadA [Firmicutes bacterium]|nr:DNA repair protein RadA [Bacillota bacterium]